MEETIKYEMLIQGLEQERDDLKNENKSLLEACITAHDALLSLHVCNLDEGRCDDLRKTLSQAIQKIRIKKGDTNDRNNPKIPKC